MGLGVFGGREFLADRNRSGSEKVFGAGVFVGFLAVGGFWGFWRLGVFGPKYGKNASKSVVFGNSCN